MSKEAQVEQLTDYMAKFIAHVAKKLPDDVIAKLTELRAQEDSPLSKTIYDTMFQNQTGQHSNDYLTAKNFRNRHYRHRLRNQNRKHLIRSGQIDSDQSSDRDDSSGKKARCRCRKPALRNHTEQTAPHRSPFSGGLYLPAQLASRMMFQCLHKKISQK